MSKATLWVVPCVVLATSVGVWVPILGILLMVRSANNQTGQCHRYRPTPGINDVHLGVICTCKEDVSLIEILLHIQNRQNKERKQKSTFQFTPMYWLTGTIEGSSMNRRTVDNVRIWTLELFVFLILHTYQLKMTDVQNSPSINRRTVVHFNLLTLRINFKLCQNRVPVGNDGRAKWLVDKSMDRSLLLSFES